MVSIHSIRSAQARMDGLDAGNLALDLLNTVRESEGYVRDALASPRDLSAWLERTGLITGAARRRLDASPPDGRMLWDEAHRLREAIGGVVALFSAGAPLPDTFVPAVNRALSLRRTSLRAVRTEAGLILEEAEEPTTVGALLAPIAAAAVELVQSAHPARVRQCHAEDCVFWFVDTSKNGTRKWCSMARCGNRAKVAAHYQRARKGAEGDFPR